MRITRFGQILDNIENIAEILKSEVSKKTEGLDDKIGVLRNELDKTATYIKKEFTDVSNTLKNEIEKQNLNSLKTDLEQAFGKIKTEVEQVFTVAKEEVEKQFKSEKPSEVEKTFAPATNIREDKENFYVEIDVPGLKREEVSIELEDKFLVVSGERKFKQELTEKDYYKVQSFKGKFVRKLKLPINANFEKIEAEIKDGVLEIVIPKVEIIPQEDKRRVVIK